MNKKEFIELIIKEKVINKKIYDASLKVQDFPEARLILTKIDENYNFNQLINTNNIVLVNSFAAALKAELYKFIEENVLRSKIEQFIIEIVDIKIPGNAKSNTYKISKNKTNSKSIKTVRSRSTQRKSKATIKNKENIKKGDVLTSELKGQKNSEGINQKNKKRRNAKDISFKWVKTKKNKKTSLKKGQLKKSQFKKDVEFLLECLPYVIFLTPLLILSLIPGINIILAVLGLFIWIISLLWERYSNDYDD